MGAGTQFTHRRRDANENEKWKMTNGKSPALYETLECLSHTDTQECLSY
jgi:hypothetical protein